MTAAAHQTHQKLDRLATAIEHLEGEGLRLDLVRRARLFKRSWVEMARALVHVRNTQAYLAWGYEDLYQYCATELQLRQNTVDKLTGSYVTLERHAPKVLERDGVASKIPTCDAVDYFAKALRGDAANDGEQFSEDLLSELKHAVFEEGRPVQALRRNFGPKLYPKSDEEQQNEHIQKMHTFLRKLTRACEYLESMAGMTEERQKRVQAALNVVQAELDQLITEPSEAELGQETAG